MQSVLATFARVCNITLFPSRPKPEKKGLPRRAMSEVSLLSLTKTVAQVKEPEAKAGGLAAKDQILPGCAVAAEPITGPVCAPSAGLPRVPPPVRDSLPHSVERDLDPVPQPGQQPATFHQVCLILPLAQHFVSDLFFPWVPRCQNIHAIDNLRAGTSRMVQWEVFLA